MTSNKLGVALVVWLIGVGLLGGYYYSHSKVSPSSNKSISLNKPSLQPLVNGVVVDKPVVMPTSELGMPSTGTTHINQTLIAETENPYSMTDPESVGNFNDSTEGKFLHTLFARINSTSDTIVTQQLSNFSEVELSTAIQISPALQRMFYGYRPSDSLKYFLYDNKLMHQFKPHAALLHYVQSVRPDGSYQAQLRGSFLPKVSNDIPARVKISFANREVTYLVRQSAGSCLIESIGPETKYFEVSFQLNLGIPHDVQTEGLPLLLWPGGIQVTIKPIDLTSWETDKKIYFVRG